MSCGKAAPNPLKYIGPGTYRTGEFAVNKGGVVEVCEKEYHRLLLEHGDVFKPVKRDSLISKVLDAVNPSTPKEPEAVDESEIIVPEDPDPDPPADDTDSGEEDGSVVVGEDGSAKESDGKPHPGDPPADGAPYNAWNK